MSKISVHIEDNIKTYISEASKMKVSELEFFVQELNALLLRKRTTSKGRRISELYQLINETVLDFDKQVILNALAEKSSAGTMTEDQNKVYQKIAQEEESIRNQRIVYMVELAQLKGIPFQELLEELGLKPLPHV